MAGIAAVTPAEVRDAFTRMLDTGAAVALAGKLPRGIDARAAALVAATGSGRRRYR
jgi:fructose-1-phosphate kinase PfkB-like protein